MTDRRLHDVACLAGVLWTLLIASAVLGQQAPTSVAVEPVRLEPVRESRRVTGELRAVRRAQVATQEEGLVLAIPVQEGQRVQAGDVLAELDSRRLVLEVKQAESDALAVQKILEERQATLEWRQSELELYQQSAERGAANIKEILDAESTARIAAARAHQAERQRDVARARIELLRERLSDMTVKAPFEGVVLARYAELGEWVGQGAALLELVSVGEIEAWLDVPQKYFNAVATHKLGFTMSLEATGRTVEVDQMRVIPLVDPRARSFSVVVTLDNSGGQLAPGMSLTAWIPTGKTAQRLTVDKDAVLRNETGTAYVYVARWQGPASPSTPAVATPVNVKELFPVGKRVVVESRNLNEGDFVVIEGNERLFPGMPILGHPRAGTGPGSATGDPR